MLRKLWFLLVGGCDHTWEVYSKNDFRLSNRFGKTEGTQYHLRCTKCGRMSLKEMM